MHVPNNLNYYKNYLVSFKGNILNYRVKKKKEYLFSNSVIEIFQNKKEKFNFLFVIFFGLYNF